MPLGDPDRLPLGDDDPDTDALSDGDEDAELVTHAVRVERGVVGRAVAVTHADADELIDTDPHDDTLSDGLTDTDGDALMLDDTLPLGEPLDAGE